MIFFCCTLNRVSIVITSGILVAGIFFFIYSMKADVTFHTVLMDISLTFRLLFYKRIFRWARKNLGKNCVETILCVHMCEFAKNAKPHEIYDWSERKSIDLVTKTRSFLAQYKLRESYYIEKHHDAIVNTISISKRAVKRSTHT